MTETEPRHETLHPMDPRNAARIAAWLTVRNNVGTGEIAGLRKLRDDHPTDGTFWKVMHYIGLDDVPRSSVSIWAAITRMISTSTKVGDVRTVGPHDGSIPLGRALAKSGYSENRLRALLSANASTLPTLLERMVGYLKTHDQQFNWTDAARLMLTEYRTNEHRDADRMRIARDYYREINQQLRKDTQEKE